MFGRIRDNNPIYGKYLLAEIKAKMRAAKGPVIFVYDLEGSLVNKYSSAREASKIFNSSASIILKYASSGEVF